MARPEPIRIGCSGWNYRHWRGSFYPEKMPVRCWFDHYAAVFDTVEINNSFYRLPPASTFEKWRNQAPPGFCYAVKANRFLTQAKKLHDCAEPLKRMLTAMRHLKPHLGPILYQLPPRFRINCDRLESFLNILPRDFAHIFEFRDKSWFDEAVLKLLDSHDAGFCVHDMHGLETPRWASGPAAYIRFHGTSGKYVGRYSDDLLEDWAGWIGKLARSGRPVWAYFNNDIHAHAVEDARNLRSILDRRFR
jgi:uncharacterized protein YecE (DUF72 family)